MSRDSLRKIVYVCQEKGLKVKISDKVLYADALGNNTYLKMMEHNAEVLVHEWQ